MAFLGEIRSYARPDGGRLVWLPEDKTYLFSNRANRICSQGDEASVFIEKQNKNMTSFGPDLRFST